MKNNEKKVYKHKFKSKIPALTIIVSVIATIGLAVGAGFFGNSIGASMIADPSNAALLTTYKALGSVIGGLLGLFGGIIATVPVVQAVLHYSEKAGWKQTAKSNQFDYEDNKEIIIENAKEKQNNRNKEKYMEYVVKEYLKAKETKLKHNSMQNDEQEKE